MTISNYQTKRADYYLINHDFSGSRQLDDNNETVEFRNHSIVRIWYNDLAVGFEPHCHNALEIIVPVENSYDAIINHKAFHVNPNEILIIPSGSIHELQAPSKGIRFIHLFDLSFMEKLHSYNVIMSLISKPILLSDTCYPTIYKEISSSLTLIRNEYFSQNDFSDFAICSIIMNCLGKIGNLHIQELQFPESIKKSCRQKEYVDKFHDIMQYIDNNYTENLNLETLADSIGFSKYHFSRLFKQYTNYNFCDYVNYRRVSIAEELLANGDIPITQVAMQSGFGSISTFNRLFKELKGCSPSEYRTIHTVIHFS